MLITTNEREQNILKTAFEQQNIKVIITTPSYSNYIKILQFQVDIVLMELPTMHTEQLRFSSMIRKNVKTRKVPIIGYGNPFNEGMKAAFQSNGITQFIQRPLKFSALLDLIKKYLQALQKKVDDVSATKVSDKQTDIQAILNPETPAMKKLELMVKHVSGLMAFPFTVTKVLQMVDNEKTAAADLSKVIKTDPVISTHILKVSNSIFFASTTRRIESIKDAIVRIGFKETRRIVIGMMVMEIISKENRCPGFSRMDFWYHSLATAVICEYLAKHSGAMEREDAFMAGLLHDFGIVLLDEFYPTIFSKIMEATTTNSASFMASEREILKLSHNDLVKELFTLWKIPEAIRDAISLQYNIPPGAENEKPAYTKMSLGVYVSNLIAKALCAGAECDQYFSMLNDAVYDELKLTTLNSDTLSSYLNSQLEIYKRYFNIKTEGRESARNPKSIGIVKTGMCPFNPVEHYLAAQGHSIVRIKKGDSYEEYVGKCDIVFVWAHPETAPDNILPITRLSPKNAPAPGTQNGYAPVVLMVHQSSPLHGIRDIKNLTVMHNEFDLRQLDIILAEKAGGGD